MPWTDSQPMLHYRLDGSGSRPVVLLHEMGGSSQSWNSVVPALADAFRILRLDQRGAGLSEKVRADYANEALIDDVDRVLDVAEMGEVYIAAAAAAGAVAVGYALRYPGRVRGLLLCAPALGVDPAARAQAVERAAMVERDGMRAIIDSAMARMYPETIRGEAYADYRCRFLAGDPVGFGLANRAFAATEVDLAALDVPTLLLAGRHDVRPIEAVTAMAARATCARIEIVEGGGHVMPVQAPVAVAAHVRAFFGGH